MPVFPFVPEPSWLTAAAQAGRREGEESCELVCVSGAQEREPVLTFALFRGLDPL